MDKLDQQIISLLSGNARMTYTEIARKVGLSTPAVKSRMLKLEEEGIIEGYRLQVNYHALGFPVTAFVRISVSSEQKEEFLAYLDQCPEVTECYGITGDYFALMKVRCRSTMELDRFLTGIQKFGETSTNIALSEYHCRSTVE